MRHMRGMPALKYGKDKLLGILKDNREKHIKAYEKAKKEYLDACKVAFTDLLKDISGGKEIDHTKKLKKLIVPETYVEHYDRAIDMLELTTQAEIELEQEAFLQLVKDEWDWKSSFDHISASNSAYLA